jgi:hypothetical protein
MTIEVYSLDNRIIQLSFTLGWKDNRFSYTHILKEKIDKLEIFLLLLTRDYIDTICDSRRILMTFPISHSLFLSRIDKEEREKKISKRLPVTSTMKIMTIIRTRAVQRPQYFFFPIFLDRHFW